MVCSENTLILLPDTWSFEDGAQLGVATFTSYQCLVQSLKLPISNAGGIPVLIWAGSTSVGHYAIQMAREAGLRIISTASPSKFDKVKALGAEMVFDYKDPKAGERINKYTDGTLTHVIDCISERTTPYQTSRSTNGGTVATLQPYVSRQKGVQTKPSLAYALIGEVRLVPPFCLSNLPDMLTHSFLAIHFPREVQPYRRRYQDGQRCQRSYLQTSRCG